jgi:hypothetical protein
LLAVIVVFAFSACANPRAEDNAPSAGEANDKITVTISIDCLTLLASDPDMAGQVSDEGVMLAEKGVEVASGANVYEVLRASGVSFVGEAYISSISGLSEGDGGARSGWMYSVNGVFPTVGVTKYVAGSGDHVRFRYTLDGGADVR